MSTKGLMAHKKVASVTVNEAGKAATLTLADPWRYRGQAGPFDLLSVDHGHDIVKKARPDGTEQYAGPEWSFTKRSPVARDGQPRKEGAPPQPSAPRSETGHRQAPPPTGPMLIYRWSVADPKLEHTVGTSTRVGHEITGWLRPRKPWPDKDLKARAVNEAKPFMREDGAYTEVKVKRWRVADERTALKEGATASPWCSEHLNAGDMA